MNSSTKKTIILISVIFLIIAIPASITAFILFRDIRSRAGPTEAPQEVTVSNVTSEAFTVAWLTSGAETEGYIKYGLSADNLDQVAEDDRDASGSPGSYRVHHVTVDGLGASTKYYYKIVVGSEEYDNGGNSYEAATGPILDMELPAPVKGQITSDSGPAAGVLVLLQVEKDGEKSSIASTFTAENGTWTLDLGTLRSADVSSYFAGTDEGKLIITAKAGDGSVGTYEGNIPGADEAVPTIALGESTDTYEPTPEPTPQPDTQPSTRTTATVQLRTVDSLKPLNVTLSNVTENSWTLSWTTVIPATGYVEYGTSSSSLDQQQADEKDTSVENAGEWYTHHVTVTNRNPDPDTTYYYRIDSGGKKYDNNGRPYSHDNPKILNSPPSSTSASGTLSLSTVTGTLEDVVVYVRLKDSDGEYSTWGTTTPTDEGGWNVNLGILRNAAMSGYFDLNSGTLEIEARGMQNSYGSSEVNLDALEGSIEDEEINIEMAPGLSLLNLSHGDSVNSGFFQNPGAAGTAPGGEKVQIQITSSPIYKELTADASGAWLLKLMEELDAGEHSITLATVGADGQEQIQTIEFTVLGASDAIPQTGLFDEQLFYLLVALTLLLIGGLSWVWFKYRWGLSIWEEEVLEEWE